MIQMPQQTRKRGEVVIHYEGLESSETYRFLDARRAERYAQYHNRMRELGFRDGTAVARCALPNCG